jgi:hypothetical protein
MPQAVFFALLLLLVLVLGAWWMLRSAAQPSDDGDADPDAPVVVSGPGSHMDMEVYRSKLEAAGIFAYTRNRNGPTMPGGVAPRLFGWEVLVRRADAEAAEEVLAVEVAELPSPEPRV